jgi:glycosyltransferase involved in cell wall biosynthesis
LRPSSSKPTEVLFFRDYKRFTGGDLKVWDYFNHVRSSPRHTARILFTPESVWDSGNPWSGARDHVVHDRGDVDPDILFLSGTDWRRLERTQRRESPIPIVNLIQHVRHACPDDPLGRYNWLPHKAIRICVGPEVTRALERTGRVRGPLFTIPDAIDLDAVARHATSHPRDLDLLVVANKQPELGRALHARLADGLRTALIDERTPQPELLRLVGSAAVTLFVPNPKEGFYLPAVEGMALRTVVVCPDCIGNRSFCQDGVNCFRPDYDEGAIVRAATEALGRRDELGEMLDNATETARAHDLADERSAFLAVLDRVADLWAAA